MRSAVAVESSCWTCCSFSVATLVFSSVKMRPELRAYAWSASSERSSLARRLDFAAEPVAGSLGGVPASFEFCSNVFVRSSVLAKSAGELRVGGIDGDLEDASARGGANFQAVASFVEQLLAAVLGRARRR